MVNFIIRQFAGKAAAAVATVLTILVLHGFAFLCAKVPSIAALCDPQAVATWCDTAVIAIFNILANKYHMDAATETKIADELKANPPVIPIRRATLP